MFTLKHIYVPGQVAFSPENQSNDVKCPRKRKLHTTHHLRLREFQELGKNSMHV